MRKHSSYNTSDATKSDGACAADFTFRVLDLPEGV